MNSNYRIIISTSSLNIEDWTDLYRFIDSIYTNSSEDAKLDALHILKEKNVKVWYAPESNSDVYQLDGKELTNDVLKRLSKNTCYSILYQKDDDTEEFTGLAPFVFFLRRFKDDNNIRSHVSLGIGTDGFKDQDKLNSFKFKCSNFFLLYDTPQPVLGEKTIYFFSTTNKETINLAGKRNDSHYPGNPNRRFLPLFKITKENYHSIFTSSGNDASNQSKDSTYVNKSLKLIKNTLRKKRTSKFTPITDYTDSLFGQWLINGYFNSYEEDELMKMSPDDIKGTIQTLQIYKNSIFELIQNIIFHGGKEGLFYCAFDKKENVSSYYQNKLPDLGKEASKVNRFLRVGIYDYHQTGIVDSFKKRGEKTKPQDAEVDHKDLSLIDFFDTESIATIGIIQLEMRYAASLGIKSFVRTVFKHNGYFSVESNEVVNGHNVKKRISSIWKDDRPCFLPESIIENYASGTHYEIILPVTPSLSTSAPTLQRETFFNLSQTLQSLLDSYQPIKVVDLDCKIIARISGSTTKEQQITAIKNVGNDIINNIGDLTNEIALNLNGNIIDHTLMFKILAYIQLNATNPFKKIILFNGTDDFVNDFCRVIYPFLSNLIDNDVHVWSNEAAIILISKHLHVQIICGNNKEVLFALNREFKKYYCYNSFPEKNHEPFILTNHYTDYPKENLPGEFILPYDLLIEPKDGTTLFELYSFGLLKQKIIPSNLGFQVNHENTYIGNKIIVRNYYEADMMFQNSFFADRFAYLITQNIKKTIKDQQLVLIGYKHYSEYLLKAIKHILNSTSVHIVIADEDNDATSIGMTFNFDIDGDRELQKRILASPNNYLFGTIVPIGATLSTNDKIIALFKLWHKQHSDEKTKSSIIDFVYNHCVIIVRDLIVEPEPSSLEIEQKWTSIDSSQRCITTNYQNAKNIYFTIQIAKERSPLSRYETMNHNWLKRLNNEISFPQKWQDEKYVNYTENSSINSQNLMGFPRVDYRGEDQHIIELNRLYLLRNDIYKGHFVIHDIHQKFFIDTESFVRSEIHKSESEFTSWLRGLKNKLRQDDKLNILITPNAETESDFISTVNEQIFDGNALIIYLDVKNWRNNIVHKLAFLKNLNPKEVSFHFVDHVLFTGETYLRAKSYLYSINDGIIPSIFSSIITIINRLPYTKNKEINEDVNKHFFSFINLYYPISKLDGKECELCKLQDYYVDLNKKTVLDSCKLVIKKNVNKLDNLFRKNIDELRCRRDALKSKQDFLRLIMTHELFYRISQIAWQQSEYFDLTRQDIHNELDAIYNQLCDKPNTSSRNTNSKINKHINDWLKPDIPNEFSELLEYSSKKLETDKKISFLKVISSPPLSQYIIIREYAHSKLLCELNEIIHKTNDNNHDDLKIVKSILKSLSFLKSNALVRQGVIIGAWELLERIIIRLNIDNTRKIENLEKKSEERLNSLNIELTKLNTREQLTLSEGERRSYLISTISHAKDIFEYLDREKNEIKRLLSTTDEIIKDFSRDIQFFIKNAIVENDAKATFLGELLRKGEEMTTFDNFKISKTKLTLKIDTNKNDKNNLFEYFKKNHLSDNDTFKKEYINFLVWLFYDNTTIIRRTLDNFSNELRKDNEFKSLFYKTNGPESKLRSITELMNNIFRIKKKLEDIINNEYYYYTFKLYLDNEDGIDFVTKLVYVIYAKLKLKDIIYSKNKTTIEADIKDLLNIFSEIMGADMAFFTMKNDAYLYPFPFYRKLKTNRHNSHNNQHSESKKNNWNYYWDINNFYTSEVLSLKNLNSPIFPKFEINQKKQPNSSLYYGEFSIFKMHSMVLFVIASSKDNNDNCKENDKETAVASITFLYDNKNPLIKNETFFRICAQESGRLLLLLKQEIDKYVIEYLIKDKVFDLWVEKNMSSRKFDKIYAHNNHIFTLVYQEMDEFERLDDKSIKQLCETWFFLANETISFIYSDIERHKSLDRKTSEHYLNLARNVVIDESNTLGQTFNDKFITLLLALLDSKWKNDQDSIKSYQDRRNEIIINGQNLRDFDLEESLRETPLFCNKHLMRTFIAQCLHNSLSPLSRHGHRSDSETKRICITITKSHIRIEDYLKNDDYPEDAKKRRAESFKMKKKYIKQMNCDQYSSTTLTSLQGFVNYMKNDCDLKKQGIRYHCNYGFNKLNNFFVTIIFNGQNNEKENCDNRR